VTEAEAVRQSIVREDMLNSAHGSRWAVALNLRKEEKAMNKDYAAPEVLEIGSADEVILGGKLDANSDQGQDGTIPASDLDD
jgi:hypothetical protein